NGPGEALISQVGLAGAKNKSGFYIDGERQKERLDNNDLVDQLERHIRAKVKRLEAEQIPVKQS
ncbi:MAG TPA: 4-hydroxy-3-methylbut-2-en-1-yl diphosphate synthase, partial [Pseudidiomarina sp.]|nr:4-hydroxy-3-methylbut-2-en-1-yl diphosphate synthase [Pseudidiomarina sp.]